jgi:hypothetical protein
MRANLIYYGVLVIAGVAGLIALAAGGALKDPYVQLYGMKKKHYRK